MRLKLSRLEIDGAIILPVRESHRISSSYHTSLKMQLNNYYYVNVSLYSVKPDGNSLYGALSHLILRNKEHYNISKTMKWRNLLPVTITTLMSFDNPASLVTRNYGSIFNRFPSEMHRVQMLNFVC